MNHGRHGISRKAGRELNHGYFEKLSDLMEPLDLGWKERTKKELELMDDLIPLLKKLAGGREIAGLGAYE